jgi:acid phosphatase (class A)
MRQKQIAILIGFLICVASYGQDQSARTTAPNTLQSHTARTGYYVDTTTLDTALVLPSPPSQNSALTKHELDALHGIEKERTPTQISIAQTDDQEQDIFLFKDVLGKDFNAENLPLTASLSAHIHSDEGVASSPLKTSYGRPRPYQIDSTLHPVCKVTTEPNSYPSGHALSGYLLAFTLAHIVPEMRDQIFKRADAYAHNRLVCGVHYATDIEASRTLAAVMFGSMLANPNFQKDIAAAKKETYLRLSMPVAANDRGHGSSSK